MRGEPRSASDTCLNDAQSPTPTDAMGQGLKEPCGSRTLARSSGQFPVHAVCPYLPALGCAESRQAIIKREALSCIHLLEDRVIIAAKRSPFRNSFSSSL